MSPSTKYFSDRHESGIVRLLGDDWCQVPGSGCGDFMKCDVVSDQHLFAGECKTHTAPRTTIKFDWEVWRKLEAEAISCHKSPIYFADDGTQIASHTLCLFRSANLNKSVYSHTSYVPVPKWVKVGTNICVNTTKMSPVGSNNVIEFPWRNTSFVLMPICQFKYMLGE